MNAQDIIDSYVHDVARRLPPGQRADVTLELRTLLTEDLNSRPAPDADTALQMLREFGRPAETATRYHQPFTIIEPSDTWGFLVAAIAGAAVIPLLAVPRLTAGYADLAQQATVAFLGWLGALTVLFGVKNLILRHRPDAFPWRPRPVRNTESASRTGGVVLALLWTVLLVLHWAPGWLLATLSGGRIEPGELAYSDSFTVPWRMPWLIALLVTAIGLHLLVAIQGRWRRGTRWAQIALTLLIGQQFAWHARYGSIFQDSRIDRFVAPAMALAAGVILIVCVIEVYREYNRIRPTPASS